MSIRDLARQRLAASEIQRAFHVSPSTDETLKHPKGDALAAETSFGKHQHNHGVSGVSGHETHAERGASPTVVHETLKQAQRDAFEERAAICEFDGGISREHAEALAMLQVQARPASVSEGQMAEIIDLAARRLDALSARRK